MKLITKDSKLEQKLASALHDSTSEMLNLDTGIVAKEFLSKDRAIEQINLLKNEIGLDDLKGKKLLEIGSGVGAFLITARKEYGIDSYGIEPSSDEFSSFNEVSNALLLENGVPGGIITKGNAEKLPFDDSSYDLIYSSNVIEHVNNPYEVMRESLRVLKPGGYLQFVIPNYFSFWEGHYGILWPCITNKALGKLYVKLLGRNPSYVDTLQLISPGYLKKILKDLDADVEILGWGKEIFKKRLTTGNYSDWASLKRIRLLVEIAQKLKLSSIVALILNFFNMQTPIVITLRKN